MRRRLTGSDLAKIGCATEIMPKKYLCRCEFQPKRSCLKHPDYQKLPWTTKIWRDEDVVDAVKDVDFQLVYR